MRAFLVHNAGGPEVLREEIVDLPVIGDNDVLVETKAIGLNPADYKIRREEQGLAMVGGGETPVILGWDIAGIVVDCGANVSHFKRGDRVFGMVNFPGQGKAYAEYVSAPEGHLAKIPTKVGFVDSAATTLAALTAYQVLNGKVKNGDKVLIHAGSGGVGHFAVQMAKQFGGYVISTSSAKNRDFVMSLGADEHIDYREQKFDDVLDDMDFVFDTVGGQTMEDSVNVLGKGGELVTLLAFEAPVELVSKAERRGATVSTALVQSSGVDLAALADMLRDGTLKPAIAATFDFGDLPAAHAELEKGRSVGKVVITL